MRHCQTPSDLVSYVRSQRHDLMLTMDFKFYEDPGHGWLAVKRSLLVELGIEQHISPFSYQKGKTVYLEEDCDANRFVKAMETRGIKVNPVYKIHGNRSPIRSYESYAYQP